MSDETQNTSLRKPVARTRTVSCPSCGTVVPPSKKQSQTPLVGYHHCRGCGLVFREPTPAAPS